MSSTVDSVTTKTDTSSLYKDASKSAEMDKTQFLTLLITQMQYQDPLNPQDPSEFTSQLAQYSNLEQLINVNDSLGTMGDSIKALQMLQAASNNNQTVSLIGKNVLYEGDDLKISGGKADDLNFYASEKLSNATVNIIKTDASGKQTIVRSLQLGSCDTGIQDIDLSSLEGGALPDGNYTVSISATNTSGTSATVPVLVRGRVGGIYFENGQTLVAVNGERIPLSDVYSVQESASA
ncbi:MAG TPA: flagellar hook capping FlgD N-terminal domain-containing protein [Candidatus Sumerlaeota bacterium]|nr:flagellar hook capping FlgD N-terminal domain-containing protein [Candidatus Sumerlaeota bacterium]HPS01204.1 flagellar hook capping FlgD N-terminal domain-containing protein [Candidatus Sumerlaeota bacterium]